MSNSYQKYKQTQVTSASREKLLLMMYEGAIKFVKRAMIAIDNKNIPDRCENIGRAFDIILELQNTLDHKVGGDISKSLDQLYMFITDRFVKANTTGTKEPLNEALSVLETLYQGWVQAIEKLKKDETKSTSAAKSLDKP